MRLNIRFCADGVGATRRPNKRIPIASTCLSLPTTHRSTSNIDTIPAARNCNSEDLLPLYQPNKHKKVLQSPPSHSQVFTIDQTHLNFLATEKTVPQHTESKASSGRSTYTKDKMIFSDPDAHKEALMFSCDLLVRGCLLLAPRTIPTRPDSASLCNDRICSSHSLTCAAWFWCKIFKRRQSWQILLTTPCSKT